MSNESSRPNQLKLAVFDLDGTLMAAPSPYGYVHHALGVEEEAAEIKARYLRGELSYWEWGLKEITLWRNLPVRRLQEIVGSIPYLPGALDFVRRLRSSGVVVALVSAGFDLHVERCAAELEVDVAYYNRLGMDNGRLTGEYSVKVDSHNKGSILQEIQRRFGLNRDQTMTAGDTLHDTQMFPHAALSIAVAPGDQGVAEAADLLLPDGDWSEVWAMIEAQRPGWLPQ